MAGSRRFLDLYLRELQALRDRHCRQVLEEARRQAADLLKPAFQAARQRARTALTEERARLRQKIQSAEVRLRTARLQVGYRRQVHLLHLAYDELQRTLLARWLDADGRAQWVAALLDAALEGLPPPAGWEIRHPPDWDQEEIEAARCHLGDRGLGSLTFVPDQVLRAGLRIHCAGVVLDGSAAGLTVDRQGVEARLLALLLAVDGRTEGR
jgi:hypothetical protein